MAATAPDSTTLFSLYAACADDDAIRAMVASTAGKNLRVASDHVLAGAVVSKFVTGASGTEVLISWEAVEHAILHVSDVQALSDLAPNWVLRPEFMSQVVMDLKMQGGLEKMSPSATEGDVIAAVVKAAKAFRHSIRLKLIHLLVSTATFIKE